MSAKDYIFDLEELKIWNDTVENVQKLRNTRAMTKGTDSKIIIDNKDNKFDKKSIKHENNTHTDDHYNTQAKALEFGDSSRINSHMLKIITRGNYKIDKILDLHRYSREQAYSELMKFLDNACEQKYRMVLIITGKGNSSPGKRSILKSSLLNWLETYNSSERFLYIGYAHPKHGGNGAVYIVLKKRISTPVITRER